MEFKNLSPPVKYPRSFKGGPGTSVGGITGLNQKQATNRKHPYRFRADRLSLSRRAEGELCLESASIRVLLRRKTQEERISREVREVAKKARRRSAGPKDHLKISNSVQISMMCV